MRNAARSGRASGRLLASAVIVVAIGTSAWFGRAYVKAGYALTQLSRRYAELELERIPRGARVACFVAHADDECYIMAGVLARLAAERDADVTLISLTQRRGAELHDSARALGLARAIVFDGIESISQTSQADLDRAVASLFDELDPDVVVSFGPEGITGNPEHQATSLAVWRTFLRRGRGMLLRAVMPRELNDMVGKYSAANEPGWGIGPIHRVPLGTAGELRRASADCYRALEEARAALEPDEWKAHVLNTEFYAVTELEQPASAPELLDSATAEPIRADEILVVVHPTWLWDLRRQAEPAIDELVDRFEAEGRPVVVLVNETYPFTYLDDSSIGTSFVSSGGEHDLTLNARRIWFAGGSFGACLERAIQFTLHEALRRGVTELELVLPTDAVYSVVFDDESIGAITLADRVRSSGDGGEELVRAMVDRLRHDFPVLGYPTGLDLGPLDELLDGYEIGTSIEPGAIAIRVRASSTDGD